MPKSNRSGNTKRKIRNQKKQESTLPSLAEETNKASTSKLEEEEKTACEHEFELSTERDVKDPNAGGEYSYCANMCIMIEYIV